MDYLSVEFALQTLGIVFHTVVESVRRDEGRLDGETAGTVYQIVSMQESERVIEALLAHIRKYLQLSKQSLKTNITDHDLLFIVE